MRRWNTLRGTPCRVIAHRGASGQRPEHTLAAYQLALAQGADVLEPDLLPARDGTLFARHDLGLARSTDIARRRFFETRAVRHASGRRDWLIHHFSAEELDALRAIQPVAGRSPAFDSRCPLPRFAELLAYLRAQRAAGHPVGLYPELKHPDLLARSGIDVVASFLNDLRLFGHAGKGDPVWFQCFEVAPLWRVHEALELPVFFLREAVLGDDSQTLRQVHRSHPWLDGVAFAKSRLIGPGAEPDLVVAAHDLGWEVHAYTLRDDQVMAPYRSVESELAALYELGVDALFADFPATALRVRSAWERGGPEVVLA